MPSLQPALHLASFAASSSSALRLAPVQRSKAGGSTTSSSGSSSGSSSRRSPAELALAVDGEGLWRYDLETLHPTWSSTVPPTTTFLAPPLALSTGPGGRVITLASTASSSTGGSPELWAFGRATTTAAAAAAAATVGEAAGEDGGGGGGGSSEKELVGGVPKGHEVDRLFALGLGGDPRRRDVKGEDGGPRSGDHAGGGGGGGGPWALVRLAASTAAAGSGGGQSSVPIKGKGRSSTNSSSSSSRSYAVLSLSPSSPPSSSTRTTTTTPTSGRGGSSLSLVPLALVTPSTYRAPSADSGLIYAATYPAGCFPSLALPPSAADVLLEVFALGQIRLWAVVLPTTTTEAATATTGLDGEGGLASRKGRLELVREGAERSGEGWEEGERAVEVAVIVGGGGSTTGSSDGEKDGILQILTDRSHIHTLSLGTLRPLAPALALQTPPPHALAPVGPYSLLLTPGQMHLLSPVFGSAVIGSLGLPSSTFTSAMAVGGGGGGGGSSSPAVTAAGAGKVAFIGRKADKWGVWVGEVGLDGASGRVGEVMWTQEATAKVLGPLHPHPSSPHPTTMAIVDPTAAAVEDRTAAEGRLTSSVGQTKHFKQLLHQAEYGALLQLLSSDGGAGGAVLLPVQCSIDLLTHVFDLAAAAAAASSTTPLPKLTKGKFSNRTLDPELVLALVARQLGRSLSSSLSSSSSSSSSSSLTGQTSASAATDGEWRSAWASLPLGHVIEVLELVAGWVQKHGDVKLEGEWIEVGKGLPTLAELVPLLTLVLDTHLASLLSDPRTRSLLVTLSAALRPQIRTQRLVADTAGVVEGAQRALRAADRTRARDLAARRGGASGGGGAGGRRKGGAKGGAKAEAWQGLYRVEEFVL